MVNCPKCGAAVREEKAFCHNCGSPMNAAMRERDEPVADLGATVLEPPRRAAPPLAPQPITDVQPTGMASQAPTAYQPAARADFPSPPAAPHAAPHGKHRRSRRIGFGFILLLLFLMFLVFVFALWLD